MIFSTQVTICSSSFVPTAPLSTSELYEKDFAHIQHLLIKKKMLEYYVEHKIRYSDICNVRMGAAICLPKSCQLYCLILQIILF